MKDWRWPLVALLVAWLGFLAVHETCRSLREGPRTAVKDAADAVGTIAERFHTGRITTTFTAALPKLQPGGAVLELAPTRQSRPFGAPTSGRPCSTSSPWAP